MATPNDPTTSHGSFDAVIAGYMQAVEAGEVPNLQRLGGECPRQELNLVLDLRGVVCESVTLRGRDQSPVPRPEIGSGPAASKTAVRPTHSRGAIRAEGVPSPGIEPGPRPSEGRVLIRHTPRAFRAKAVVSTLRRDTSRRPDVRAKNHGSDARSMMNGNVSLRLLRSRTSAVTSSQPSRSARAT
jgi:hypothetical protein